MNAKLKQVIEALLSDITAMQEGNHEYWYGPFSVWTEDLESDTSSAQVEWPNLTLSAAKVAELLPRGQRLEKVLDDIEAFFDNHNDGAPDARPWQKECGRLLERLQVARAVAGGAKLVGEA